ncbi:MULTISPECIES: hypothetical protein [unclassified Streptomyces]|uniref:hypothetical protein n=1 Tax=unclassified Streptomyces TaxID=2593676 RepID=UPI0037F592B2
MGNSAAYPVLRTTDATAAFAQASRLRALLAECEDEVGLFAQLRTVADLRRMAAVLPEAAFEYTGKRSGPAGEAALLGIEVTAADDPALERHLPFDLMVDVPGGGVEERFAAVLGRGTAAISWRGMWPDDPETGRHGSLKYDGVQVVFHGNNPQLGPPWAADHTVHVHVDRLGDLARARKLAAHIGGQVLGGPLLGW